MPKSKPRPYHVLLTREATTEPWGIAFGAYDRSDVVAEREDLRDHGAKLINLCIHTCNDASQIALDNLVYCINGGARYIALLPHAWGEGATPKIATRLALANKPSWVSSTCDVQVWRVGPTAEVTEHGDIRYAKDDMAPELVA
jgi:hypothetical protein